MEQVKWSITTPASSSVVELSEAKAQLVVESDDDDILIQSFIESATDYAEQYTGLRFINQTVTYKLDSLPSSSEEVEVPSHNASAVTAISYVDAADATQAEDLSDYYIDTDSMSTRIKPVSGWPSIRSTGYNNFTITITEGFGAEGDDVPKAIKQAVLMTVAHYYRNRESTVVGTTAIELPLGVKSLLDKYRVIYRKQYGGS